MQEYKYLGILISLGLSRSPHVANVCSKTRKITGLLYGKFSQHAGYATLLWLYISLMRPHLEYAAAVWDPRLQRDIQHLESVQKFSLGVCTKHGHHDYLELLEQAQLTTLAKRRLYLKLCHIYKIIYNLCHFPSNVISLSTNRSHRSHSFQPFARTNSYYNSFLPHAIFHWNSLPNPVVCAISIREFKGLLRCIL